MLRRHLSLILAVLFAYTAGVSPVFAQSAVGKAALTAEEVKQSIAQLGLGPEARVRVQLLDRREFAGHVTQDGPDSFTLMDRKTGAAVAVPYTQVKRISGGNKMTGAHFSLPQPEPRDAPKWLKGVGKGATVGLSIVMMAVLMSAF